MRRPLGIAIVGGLLVSQVLTLYTTPVIYLYMDRLRQDGQDCGAEPLAAAQSPLPLVHTRPIEPITLALLLHSARHFD